MKSNIYLCLAVVLLLTSVVFTSQKSETAVERTSNKSGHKKFNLKKRQLCTLDCKACTQQRATMCCSGKCVAAVSGNPNGYNFVCLPAGRSSSEC